MSEPASIVEPWTVFGGWRIARVRWVRTRDESWDQEEEFLGQTVYPTEEACRRAIAELGLS